jgi:hypothetical protein
MEWQQRISSIAVGMKTRPGFDCKWCMMGESDFVYLFSGPRPFSTTVPLEFS